MAAPRLVLLIDLPANAASVAEPLARACGAADVATVILRLAPEVLARGDERELIRAVKAVAPGAQEAGAAVLVEDAFAIVARAGADGVHLTSSAQLGEALEALRPHDRIVGLGCVTTRHDAMEAGEAGVDYLMFGDGGVEARPAVAAAGAGPEAERADLRGQAAGRARGDDPSMKSESAGLGSAGREPAGSDPGEEASARGDPASSDVDAAEDDLAKHDLADDDVAEDDLADDDLADDDDADLDDDDARVVARPMTAHELAAWWAESFEIPCVAAARDASPAEVARAAETGAEFVALPLATIGGDAEAQVVAAVAALRDVGQRLSLARAAERNRR